MEVGLQEDTCSFLQNVIGLIMDEDLNLLVVGFPISYAVQNSFKSLLHPKIPLHPKQFVKLPPICKMQAEKIGKLNRWF